MTTIATDGKTIAADGLITGDGVVYGRSGGKTDTPRSIATLQLGLMRLTVDHLGIGGSE